MTYTAAAYTSDLSANPPLGRRLGFYSAIPTDINIWLCSDPVLQCLFTARRIALFMFHIGTYSYICSWYASSSYVSCSCIYIGVPMSRYSCCPVRPSHKEAYLRQTRLLASFTAKWNLCIALIVGLTINGKIIHRRIPGYRSLAVGCSSFIRIFSNTNVHLHVTYVLLGSVRTKCSYLHNTVRVCIVRIKYLCIICCIGPPRTRSSYLASKSNQFLLLQVSITITI